MALSKFIEQSNAADSIDGLTALFDDELNDMGFGGGFCYAALSIKSGRRFTAPTWGPILYQNYPKEWCAYYAEQNCLTVDPTIRLAPTAETPFGWRAMAGISRHEARFMELSRVDAGFKDGMTVPIRGAMGDLYLFGIAATHNDGFAPDTASQIYLLTTQFHAAFLKLGSEMPEQARRPISLSPRERQCMEWVSRGKSNWEISVLLGVSERTVKDYLQSVFRKFDVHDRTQATVFAIMRGLIKP